MFDQEALAKADEIDQKIKAGTAGKLAGMVIGIKDLLCYKDHPSAAGSRILEGFESQFNATAVQRVIDADAIIIGSQNCDEFGMGSTNENSAYGACLNAVGGKSCSGWIFGWFGCGSTSRYVLSFFGYGYRRLSTYASWFFVVWWV